MSSQPTRHPLLEALHRELGVGRIAPVDVVVAGRRWSLRPLTLDDQIWAASKFRSNAGDNFLIYASEVAISLAAVGDLATEVVAIDQPVMNEDGTVKLGDDGKPATAPASMTRALPVDQQPAMLPAIAIWPPVWSSEVAMAVATGMQAAPVFSGDPMDPPNPWRELVADQVFKFLLQMPLNVAQELFFHQSQLQSRVEVPQLPLPPPSPKATTT